MTTSNQKELLRFSDMDIRLVYAELLTNEFGLTTHEVRRRFAKYGKNLIGHDKVKPWYLMLLQNFNNPLVYVLFVIGMVSYLTHDVRSTIVVSVMILLSACMRFVQEFRSSRAAEALRKMVRTHATVKRNNQLIEIPIEDLVPGDLVHLTAGDMIPGDLRVISSNDLFISQAALTGESLPIEKFPNMAQSDDKRNDPLKRSNLCFMGTSVLSGIGEGVIIYTGAQSSFGHIAANILGKRSQSNFDIGLNALTIIIIKFICIMIFIIFALNWLIKGDWQNAFFFAIAVGVGITPELFPMIITTNLAKGAVAISKYKVIVKRLNALQGFGAMNILCTDKTGTLTQNRMQLKGYVDADGTRYDKILNYCFLNSHFQNGLRNALDQAILENFSKPEQEALYSEYHKIDEVPFDFERRRMSVAIQATQDKHLVICKGFTKNLLEVCSHVETVADGITAMNDNKKASILNVLASLSQEGLHSIGVAYKLVSPQVEYHRKDESDLVFLGIITFLDPPKESAKQAIELLKQNNIKIKVLTGDNEIITQRICNEVNLESDTILLGPEIEEMDDFELARRSQDTAIFATLTPLQKSRIIKALKSMGNVVGFLGDGINDAPALRESDVSISVDSAVDIARESADIILLEKNLLVLNHGVLKGREVYGNIIKYIKMAFSSNFGNVLSMVIASVFLPFLPMLPIQILVQNLLYDFSQTTLPWDRMDAEYLKLPHQWDPRHIVIFMLCIGPISSIFDIATFGVLWNFFGANDLDHQALFHSGWFVEGLLTQTLIVHVIRTRKIPFLQSTASLPLLVATFSVIAIGIMLPFSTIGDAIKLVPLPSAYFVWLGITILCYVLLTQIVKTIYIKRFNSWL